jgi:hypothetical protein
VVFTAVAVKNTVFCDVKTYGSCKNRRFGGKYRLHHRGDKNRRARNSVLRLLVTANVISISLILVTLHMEAIRSSETSALIRATQRNIPEEGILGRRQSVLRRRWKAAGADQNEGNERTNVSTLSTVTLSVTAVMYVETLEMLPHSIGFNPKTEITH